MSVMDVTIRRAKADDAELCGRICYEAFCSISQAHNFPPDFPSAEMAAGLLSSLFKHPRAYAIVAEVDGRIVGSNVLWENGSVAGVGPITVDPGVQNGSVGRRMMEAVLARAKEQQHAGVRLVQAAFHNRSLSLYAKLGFVVREPLSNMQGPKLGIEIPGCAVRAAAEEDLAACDDLCRRVHGHSRSDELLDAIRQGTARVVERGGRVTGYTTQIGFFGHAVGESNEELKAMIGAAEEFAGPGFLLPTRNSELFLWCLRRGLRVVQPATLMSVGLYNEPAGAFLPSILY